MSSLDPDGDHRDTVFADTVFARSTCPAPEGWDRADQGLWVVLRPQGRALPPQGWKVHVSSVLTEAGEVVDLVWEWCVRHTVAFKFLRGTDALLQADGKQAARGSSGKLLAVYPADEAELEKVLTGLAEVLDGRRGPYILSDLRWGSGPLYVRYGGFAAMYCADAEGEIVPALRNGDGELVPDVRGPVFAVPPWVTPPPCVRTAVEAAAAQPAPDFPFAVEKVLHFSNGGGVYLARDTRDGRQVVLREARPHAGLDANGTDAVTRLLNERDVLTRLAGVEGVPALYEHRIVWEHHFLVEEYVPGRTLQHESTDRNPSVWPDPGPAELRGYAEWVLDVLARLAELLDRVHAHGLVFGDLHPANVMVRPDGRLALVDFELAFDTGADVHPGLGALGYVSGSARDGLAVDEYALDCMRLALFLPLTALFRFDRDKPAQLLASVTERFPLPAGYGSDVLPRLLARPAADTNPAPGPLHPDDLAGPGTDWDAVLAGIAAGITAAATPEDPGRLFPGDIEGELDGATSIAYGAAGVLYALHATGAPVDGALTDWLSDAERRITLLRPGLWNGLAGIALTLDLLGRRQRALEVLERVDDLGPLTRAAHLYGGLAGIALTRLHFAYATGDRAHAQRAVDAGHRLAAVLDATEPRPAPGTGPGVPDAGTGRRASGPPDPGAPAGDPGSGLIAGLVAPRTPGLTHGWAGPALLFVRLHEHTGDPVWLDRAERALRRDLARCRAPEHGGLQVDEDGRRWLLYLAGGSGGIALAVREYLAHRPLPEFAAALSGVRHSLRADIAVYPGLLRGRAGLLLCADRLAAAPGAGPADRPARDRHLNHLSWHALRHGPRLAFPGDGLSSVSMDLGTGSAGVMLAVRAATHGDAVLPAFAPGFPAQSPAVRVAEGGEEQ